MEIESTIMDRIIRWVDSPIADLRFAVGPDDADVRHMTKGELVAWLIDYYRRRRGIDDED